MKDMMLETDLAYDDVGSGDAVLLIHGGLGDRAMWAAQVPALAQHFRVISPDLRGFGDSPLPTGPVSLHVDLHDLLASLGVERCHVVSLSFGGRVALDLTLTYPEMVRSLVLIGSGLAGQGWSQESRQQMEVAESKLEVGDLTAGIDMEMDFWIAGPTRSLTDVDAAVVAGVREMMMRNYRRTYGRQTDEWEVIGIENQRERLGEIAVPTLVMVGAEDIPEMRQIADTLTASIRNSRRVEIDDAAHHPHMERAEDVNREILNFLDARPAR